MSDPQPLSIANRPKRAEPLQPDRPGRGDKGEPPPDGLGSKESLQEQKERNETAHDNVTKGY